LAADASGRVLVTASKDRTVRLWDPATASELKTLGGQTAAVTAAAITPDGNLVLSYSDDRKLRAYDAATGKELRSVETPDELLLLTIPTGGKHALAWARRLGASEDDQTHTVQVIDPATLKPIETLSDRGRRVTCLAFSADGELVAMGSPDGSVRVWNVAKKQRVGGDRSSQAKALLDLALSPDKKTLITGDRDGEIKVWDLEKSDPVRSFRTGIGELAGLNIAADGGRLATFGTGGGVEVSDVATGRSLRKWDLRVGLKNVLFIPGGKHLATANDNGTVYLLELP
jgi:WD40 repeat protein